MRLEHLEKRIAAMETKRSTINTKDQIFEDRIAHWGGLPDNLKRDLEDLHKLFSGMNHLEQLSFLCDNRYYMGVENRLSVFLSCGNQWGTEDQERHKEWHIKEYGESPQEAAGMPEGNRTLTIKPNPDNIAYPLILPITFLHSRLYTDAKNINIITAL